MKLHYNLKGSERKRLVAAISQVLDAPAKYLGMPTVAFKVGDYIVDKYSTVYGLDSLGLEDALHQKGFNAIEREYDEPDTYESGLGGMGATPSIEDLDGEAKNWAESEMRHMKVESENVPDNSNHGPYGGDEIPEKFEGDMSEVEDSDTLTIEMPLEGFTDESIANLKKLIASKAALIKKSIGADDLPIEQTDDNLRFPWFSFQSSVEEVGAYARFIGALCAAAKQQKRVNAREKQVDNEKFTFRVFLIRLGYIGDEYKLARKILLKNLSGNSAFAKIKPEGEVPHE